MRLWVYLKYRKRHLIAWHEVQHLVVAANANNPMKQRITVPVGVHVHIALSHQNRPHRGVIYIVVSVVVVISTASELFLFYKGVLLIYARVINDLIKVIAHSHEVFNAHLPSVCNAVSVINRPGVSVYKELLRGYRLNAELSLFADLCDLNRVN